MTPRQLLPFALLALLGFACAKETLSPTQATIKIVVEPDEVDFGEVALGTDVTAQIKVTNAGTTTLRAPHWTVESTSGAFAFVDWGIPAPSELAEGDELVLGVAFAPIDLDSYVGYLDLRADADGELEVVVPRYGTGVTDNVPLLEVVPPVVAFGSSLLDSEVRQPVELRNTGRLPLTIDSLALGSNASEPDEIRYELAGGDPPWVVEPQDSVTIEAVYTPRDVGPDNAVLTVASDSGGAPSERDIILHGIGSCISRMWPVSVSTGASTCTDWGSPPRSYPTTGEGAATWFIGGDGQCGCAKDYAVTPGQMIKFFVQGPDCGPCGLSDVNYTVSEDTNADGAYEPILVRNPEPNYQGMTDTVYYTPQSDRLRFTANVCQVYYVQAYSCYP